MDNEKNSKTKKAIQPENTIICPKCGYKNAPSDTCAKCGIVFSKYHEAQTTRKRQAEEKAKIEAPTPYRKHSRAKSKMMWLAGLLTAGLFAAIYFGYTSKPQLSFTTKLVKKTQPAVATVITYDMDKNVSLQGSGFFVDNGGHLITNYHVLKGTHSAEVKTFDGNRYPIKSVVAENETTDLIKVQVDMPEGSVQWLEVSRALPAVAEHILVIGSPMGLEQTVSEGIVAAIRKIPNVATVFQISDISKERVEAPQEKKNLGVSPLFLKNLHRQTCLKIDRS
jgi:S1-C subfamily serine protease